MVWLRELHERLAPLDRKLGKRLKALQKAAKAAGAGAEETKADMEDDGETSEDEAPAPQPAPRKRLTLKERLAQLRGPAPEAAARAAVPAAMAARAPDRATKELFRLPGRRKAGARGAADAPSDLEDVDPSLGMRKLGPSLTEQIGSMQQQNRERIAKERPEDADRNVEAKPRRVRERREAAEEAVDRMAEARGVEESGMVAEARAAVAVKKGKKALEKEERERVKAMRQCHPEAVTEGRRKTSKHILQNRGLARQRKDKAGNARVSNRNKYDKMVKRRRGAVQDMREGANDGATYEGEATGVRTHLKKSLKLS